MKKSQQVMAHLFSAMVTAVLAGVGGMIVGYVVTDFGTPDAPSTSASDYLAWFAWSFNSLVRHGKGVIVGGGIGTVAGAVCGYLMNLRRAKERSEKG